MNYRFSAGIVYNNYPWPLAATAEQRQAIEEAAQAVLDVRVKYPVSSLADHLNGASPRICSRRAKSLMQPLTPPSQRRNFPATPTTWPSCSSFTSRFCQG